jgi:hypothetical protein
MMCKWWRREGVRGAAKQIARRKEAAKKIMVGLWF